jgi:hypothetical protein
MPLPTLASFEDEAIKVKRLTEEVEQLRSKLAALGVPSSDSKENSIEISRSELMDDFYIIGKRLVFSIWRCYFKSCSSERR